MKNHWLMVLGFGLVAACSQRPTGMAAADCIDPTKINPEAICTMQYDPVCGCDGKTYSNACGAENNGVRTFTKGACPEKGGK